MTMTPTILKYKSGTAIYSRICSSLKLSREGESHYITTTDCPELDSTHLILLLAPVGSRSPHLVSMVGRIDSKTNRTRCGQAPCGLPGVVGARLQRDLLVDGDDLRLAASTVAVLGLERVL
jgi:hypothetical protein